MLLNRPLNLNLIVIQPALPVPCIDFHFIALPMLVFMSSGSSGTWWRVSVVTGSLGLYYTEELEDSLQPEPRPSWPALLVLIRNHGAGECLVLFLEEPDLYNIRCLSPRFRFPIAFACDRASLLPGPRESSSSSISSYSSSTDCDSAMRDTAFQKAVP